MTAATAIHHAELSPSAVEVFRLRCWARAHLWAAGVLGLHEAVDVLQSDAERDGLIDNIGQDAVQAIIAENFEVPQ